MTFRERYIQQIQLQQAEPRWPIDTRRARRIYGTIARTICKPDTSQKEDIIQQLIHASRFLDANHQTILQNQRSYSTWILDRIRSTMSVRFQWEQRSGQPHTTLPFGAAQKLLNLVAKDWWALAQHPSNQLSRFLHAPLDNIVYQAVSRRCGRLPSLVDPRGGTRSYVYNLTREDYCTYRGWLQRMGNDLSSALGLAHSVTSVEVDQLMWGWV